MAQVESLNNRPGAAGEIFASVRTLLTGLIDYAGLFPPAQLPMPAAVYNHAHYLSNPYPWMLGRFIVPASRLEEFERVWSGPGMRDDAAAGWRLSLISEHPAADVRRIDDFNRRNHTPPRCDAEFDSIEVKTRTAAEIEAAARAVSGRFELYCEISLAGDAAALLPVLRRAGARAKIRCGGATAGGFPAAEPLAGFLQACCAARVGFKATAGLHHAMRGVYRLNYDPDSPSTVMHGFLNLLLAAAWTRAGMKEGETLALLEEQNAAAFEFSDRAVRWRGRQISAAEIAGARREFAVAFGSCSFAEPAAELRALGLI